MAIARRHVLLRGHFIVELDYRQNETKTNRPSQTIIFMGKASMFMFLPFLLALAVALSSVWGSKSISYILWYLLVGVTLFTFYHHVTDALYFSF